jgi:hypothetical protein
VTTPSRSKFRRILPGLAQGIAKEIKEKRLVFPCILSFETSLFNGLQGHPDRKILCPAPLRPRPLEAPDMRLDRAQSTADSDLLQKKIAKINFSVGFS